VFLKVFVLKTGTNSIKYSNGSIWLSVRGHGGRLVVSVKDGGRGMEEADLKQLFTHFSRLETGVGGTGLGLCISQSLIKLMNGTIQVKSEPGVGSVFSFDIPCEFGGEEARQKSKFWFCSCFLFFFFLTKKPQQRVKQHEFSD
jgi:signal transduction histidine kinase